MIPILDFQRCHNRVQSGLEYRISLFITMPLSPSTRLSHYEVLSQLGTGGMGEVYLAHDTRLNRKVALKVLPANLIHDRERLRRFEQEAQAASALNHPNIITIHEIGVDGDTHFIATEYIKGETLRRRLQTRRLEIKETLSIANQIVAALDAAHCSGIAHRDIKPENVMVREDGLVKVLDFGLAKLAEKKIEDVDREAATRAQVKTEAGMILGTVSYMSPEQARGLVVDARTDIFSLGVVLYEMLTGQRPFAGDSSNDVIASILRTEPQAPGDLNQDMPTELNRIVVKTLEKDREERYQTAKDLLVDLKHLKKRIDVQTEIERTGTPERKSNSVQAVTNDDGTTVGTMPIAAPQTGTASDLHTTSSAEYIVGKIKRHQSAAMLALAMLLLATGGLAYFFYFAQSRKAVIDSVAVLPFKNMTNDPNAEYLSDGISESLINSLSQLPQLKVIAQNSTFKYKGKEINVQEVARALGVQAIVTGRIVQRGDQLQISVEMVDARDQTHVWGEQYNRKGTDLLTVQSEISREIVEQLRLKLTNAEQEQLARRGTVNPQAYELLLKGRFYNRKGGTENRKKALEYFEQAIAVDPNYAVAYSELSVSYSILIGGSWLDPKEFTPKAEAAARRALELDESLAEAHLALAKIQQNAWNWTTAEQEFKRAIELNPNLARAHSGYGEYLSLMGRHEHAIAENERAKQLDPLSLSINIGVGVKLYHARQYDKALEVFKKTLDLDQNYAPVHGFLGYTYEAKQMYPQAITAYEQFLKLSGDDTSTQIYLGVAYAHAGQRDKAQAILKRLQATKEYVSPGELAVLYDALGEREQAFASLEQAFDAHDLQLQYMRVDPAFDPLRSDPRFTDLMRRVGLTT
jgi:serine/threonine protein kinase/Tfp pilus assembly protein PilF